MSDYQTIDITSWKQTGDELKKEVEEAVRDTQRIIVRDLPNRLVMTGKQYDMLQDDPELRGFWTQQERVWVTEYNVMDVVIKEN